MRVGNYMTCVIGMRVGMRVSPGKMFPAHVSPGMRVSPHTYPYRDACFPLVVHVSPAHISLGMRVS